MSTTSKVKGLLGCHLNSGRMIFRSVACEYANYLVISEIVHAKNYRLLDAQI